MIHGDLKVLTPFFFLECKETCVMEVEYGKADLTNYIYPRRNMNICIGTGGDC